MFLIEEQIKALIEQGKFKEFIFRIVDEIPAVDNTNEREIAMVSNSIGGNVATCSMNVIF